MKKWTRPVVVEEQFTANSNVSVCYSLVCTLPGKDPYTEDGSSNSFITESKVKGRGVDIYSNSFAGLCNESITYGAYGVNEEGNKIIGEDEYFYSVYSTKKTTRYMYQQIKDFVLKQGQIVEAIYEDGDFNIDIISPSLDNLSKVEDYISEFNDVDISCG